MPPEFPGIGLDLPGVWLPINQHAYYYPDSSFLHDWDKNNTTMYGRLKEGVSPAAARDMLRAAIMALRTQQPAHFENDEWLEPIVPVSPTPTAISLIRILIFIAVFVLPNQHCPWAFRAVLYVDNTARFDFGDAPTGVNQLGASPWIGHDEIAFARFCGSRHRLKALAMIDQDLSFDRV